MASFPLGVPEPSGLKTWVCCSGEGVRSSDLSATQRGPDSNSSFHDPLAAVTSPMGPWGATAHSREPCSPTLARRHRLAGERQTGKATVSRCITISS